MTDEVDDEHCEDCGYLFRHPAHDHCAVKDKHAPHDTATRIVWAIETDLRDRRGIRHEWDNVDDEIQDEIRDSLIAKASAALTAEEK